MTGSTVTKYYPVGVAGLPQPVKVGTTLSYLATDGLGSTSEAVDGAGNVLAQQLYAPYGGLRYSSGTMPTSKGFTGQRADSATGLDYYNARYYDPLAGQFASADTVLPGKGYDLWGLSRYAYVEGNPETRVDKDGHCFPFCAITAAVGAVIGLGVGIGAQVASGQPLTVGSVVHIAADVALGATAGAALGSGNPGAWMGAATTAAGLLLTNNANQGGGWSGAQSAFESIALGADAGFLGAKLPVPGGASLGARLLVSGLGNGALAFGANLLGQAVSHSRDIVDGRRWGGFDLTSAGVSGVIGTFAGMGSEAANELWPAPTRTQLRSMPGGASTWGTATSFMRGGSNGVIQGVAASFGDAGQSAPSSSNGWGYFWHGHVPMS